MFESGKKTLIICTLLFAKDRAKKEFFLFEKSKKIKLREEKSSA
jgi:hypothetical protein